MVRLYRTKGRNKYLKKFRTWRKAMSWISHWMPHVLEDENISNYELIFSRRRKA